jgi:predicted permease
LLLCTLAPLAIARASGAKSPSLPELAKHVVSFPPFVALLLALIPVAHPHWLDSVLERIAAALVPTAMFAVGLRLRVTPPVETRAFAFALIVKLGVMPLCALLLARALSAAPDVVAVAVVESAMPTMITAGALLMAAGLAPQLTASLVGWGIVLAQLTVPAWAYVAQRPAG